MATLVITESQKNELLKMWGLLSEDVRPLQKLMECKFTSDGKYVVYEGKAYSTETGKLVPLNEAWTLSDILHTGADVLSAGMDFVIPGSGAVVDVLNALSYIIEAQFKSGPEKDSLYLMAAITFAFVVLPGPLQAVAVPLKRAVKTGVGMTSKAVVSGLKIIGGSLGTLLKTIPNLINKALKSPLAKNILGKWGKRISGFVSDFAARAKTLLDNIVKGGKKVGGVAKKGVQKVTKSAAMVTIKKSAQKKLSNFFSKIPKIKNGKFFLRRMGFVAGKPYRYVGPSGKAMTATIKEVTDNGVQVMYKIGKRTVETNVPIETFVKNAIGAPWLRRGAGVLVPLFVKRLSDVLLDDAYGTIDYNALSKMPDLDSNETSKESLNYMAEEVASYEGDTGQYTQNTVATNFQNALMSLGYELPRFGADGKFGPETQQALKQFQADNNLTSSSGKMDRYTAKKMAELLKSKNIAGTEEIQASLNKI